MKKILIVGLGPMGIAHLKSFQNKSSKYQIFLSDLNMRKIVNKNFKLFKKFRNLILSSDLPKNLKLDLVIISTNSKERYIVIRKVLDTNKVKNILLEKFIFLNIKNYNLFKKLIKRNKIKNIFVNTWGEYLMKNLKIISLLKNKKNLRLTINFNKGDMLTNLIHYFDMFYSITKEKKFHLINKKVRIIRSKRKGYNEIDGNLTVRLGTNYISFDSRFERKFATIKIEGNNLDYSVEIDNLGFCYLYKKEKIIKKIPFPFASKKTEFWFSNFLLKKKKEVFTQNYERITSLSIQILKILNKINKRIYIT